MNINANIHDHQSYIAAQTPDVQKVLKALRKLLGKAIPEAEEVFSYQMPGYKLNGVICWYAAFKEHYSLFIPPVYQKPFEKDLKDFDCSKAGIRIPYGKPIPGELFTKMVQHAAAYNLEKFGKKKPTKNATKTTGSAKAATKTASKAAGSAKAATKTASKAAGSKSKLAAAKPKQVSKTKKTK